MQWRSHRKLGRLAEGGVSNNGVVRAGALNRPKASSQYKTAWRRLTPAIRRCIDILSPNKAVRQMR